MASHLKQNVKYMIQNVDFTTFLELRFGDTDINVVMRPKKSSLKQQASWFFNVQPGGTFQIQNASTAWEYVLAASTNMDKFILSCKDKANAGEHSSYGQRWKVVASSNPPGDFYIVTEDLGVEKTQLCCASDGTPTIKEPKGASAQEEDFRWKIVEASESDGDGKDADKSRVAPWMPQQQIVTNTGLLEGEYLLLSENNFYLHVNDASEVVLDRNPGSMFVVQLTGEPGLGNIFLYHRKSRKYIHYQKIADKSFILILWETPRIWTLQTAPPDQFCIVDRDAPTWTIRVADNQGGRPAYDTKREGFLKWSLALPNHRNL